MLTSVRAPAVAALFAIGLSFPEGASADRTPATPPGQQTVADSILAAMAELETAIGQSGPTPELLLRLGRLKRRYEGWMYQWSERPTARRAVEYARERPDEYWFNEVDANYLYNGEHFEELIRRFPESDLADDAAYELTLLSKGGECEGFVECYVRVGFSPVSDFLRRFPNSEFAGAAVDRANEAFRAHLSDIADLNAPTDQYDPQRAQTLLAEYDTIAGSLPPELQARAYPLIADLWARYLDYDRASALYRFMLDELERHVDVERLRRRLDALPSRFFRLQPAQVIAYSRVDLRWAALPGEDVTGYAVYRSTSEAAPGSLIAELPPAEDTLVYSDRSVSSEAEYWYRVSARTWEGDVLSNSVVARTPSRRVDVEAIVFNQADRQLYALGRLPGGTPEVIRVSDDGEVMERLSASFFGVYERVGREIRKRDAFVDSVLFVDPVHQSVLRYDKAEESDRREFRAAIHQGGDIELFDPARSPYYGVLVSVDTTAGRVWLHRHSGAYSLAWDYESGICWVGFENRIELRDDQGTKVREIELPHPDGSPDFVTAIHPSSGDRSAWAYLRHRDTLIEVDSTGAIVSELALADPDHYWSDGPFTVDVDRGWVWLIRGLGEDVELVKLSLEGREMLTHPLPEYSRTRIALDGASGSLWVYGTVRTLQEPEGTYVFRQRLLKLDNKGEVQLELLVE